jgi:sporulation protein YlmC with PRC-barrel domain
MDIPINVDVLCGDHQCGRSTYVVLSPKNREITHIVVREKDFPYAERLVPMNMVIESTSALIRLRCDEKELQQQQSFIKTEFLAMDNPVAGSSPILMWPYAYPMMAMVPVEHEQIPAGELAIRRGTAVEATDGRVGRVDEFLVDPKTERITHLIMREGHLWGQKDVTIPVSQIDHIEEDTVYLRLNKQEIAKLPAIPMRHP